MKKNNYTKSILRFIICSLLFVNNIEIKAQTITTNSIVRTSFCAGENINISYSITGSFGSNNVFTAQLSDSLGSFVNPVNIGQVNATTSGSISTTLPINAVSSYVYKIRVVGNNPLVVGSDNGTFLNINPIPSVNAGADQTACSNTQVIVTATVGTVAPYINWTTSGTGYFNNVTTLTGVYNPSAADINNGSVTLIVTTNDPFGPCVPAVDSVVVTFLPAAFVFAGIDQLVCTLNSNVNLSGVIGGSASSATWTTLGTGSFTNNNNIITNYSPSSNDKLLGTVKLVLTTNDPAGPCTASSDTLEIKFSNIATSNAGNDATICENDNIILLATTTATSGNKNWLTSGTGGFNDNSLLAPTYIPSQADKIAGSVLLIFTNANSNDACANTRDTMVLNFSKSVTVDAGNNQNVCINKNTVSINGSINGALNTGYWTTTGTGTFNDTMALNTIYNPSTADKNAGFVKLVLTSNDPIGPCGAVNDNLIISFNQIPIVSAGPDQTICANSVVTLHGSYNSATSVAKWTSSSSTTYNSFDSITTYRPSTIDIANGSVVLTYTSVSNATSCTVASDFVTITINAAPLANAGSDQTVCKEAISIKLNGSYIGGTSATWKTNGSGTFDSSNVLNTIYRPSDADRLLSSIKLTLTTNKPTGSSCAAASDELIVFFKNSLSNLKSKILSMNCDSTVVEFNDSLYSIDKTYEWDFEASDPDFTSNPTHTFYGANNNEIYVTINSNGECSEQQLITLDLSFQNPIADFTINTTNQCQLGNSYTLSNTSKGASNSWISTVLWNFGDSTSSTATFPNNKTYSNAGVYTITLSVLASNGCKNTISKNVNVIQGPQKPTIDVLPGLVLSSSVSGVSYEWYLNGNLIVGAKSKTYKAPKYGYYKVRVDSTNGCGSMSDDFNFKYNAIAENKLLTQSINVYPNPTNGIVNVSCNGTVTYSLYDYSGKEIMFGINRDHLFQLDISNLNKGIYLLKVNNSEHQFTTKVVLE